MSHCVKIDFPSTEGEVLREVHALLRLWCTKNNIGVKI